MISANGEISGYSTAEDFVNNVYSKYLKITKVCNNASDCNFPSQIQPNNPDKAKVLSDNIKTWDKLWHNSFDYQNLEVLDNLTIYIQTADGYSAKVFYNPKCVQNDCEIPNSSTTYNGQNHCTFAVSRAACINVIYDMNGSKKPNLTGKDIGFVTTFYSGIKTLSSAPGLPDYSVNSAYPEIVQQNSLASKYCSDLSTNNVRYSLPDRYELASVFINTAITSIPNNTYFWSGSTVPIVVSGYGTFYWYVHGNGNMGWNHDGFARSVFCVRR